MTRGQLKTQEKSNGVTAIPESVDAMDLKGSTVTIDAMGCQKEIAAAIVEKQADYLLALKANQDTLCRQVRRLFDLTEWLNYKDFATAGQSTHGKGTDGLKRVVAWPYMQRSLIMPMRGLACKVS